MVYLFKFLKSRKKYKIRIRKLYFQRLKSCKPDKNKFRKCAETKGYVEVGKKGKRGEWERETEYRKVDGIGKERGLGKVIEGRRECGRGR